ncbi:MAG TPA: flagellar regulator YcgR PilZN domain-containing protein [Gallionella sp.]|nr:flagellar regulator YcgR PilZN domain-containing protein [Gallionella sp.]
MSAPDKPGKKISPENVLYLSRIEICRILRALSRNRSSIFADIGTNWTFVSHILLVDSRKDYFVISYCANKVLNNKVLELPALTFTTSYQDAHLVFETLNPAETRLDGQPAIQYAIPRTLIYYHRREHPRIHIPAEISLRCIAEADGFAPFESRIIDISHDGLGFLLYEHDIKLEPKTILKGSRIIMPSGKAIVADLMVRNVTMIHLQDGTLACRAGLRFIQRSDEIAELVNFFVRNLDKS